MTLFQEDPPAGVSGAPTENNIMLWNAVIFGPHETPFEVRPDPTTTPQPTSLTRLLQYLIGCFCAVS